MTAENHQKEDRCGRDFATKKGKNHWGSHTSKEAPR